ncbi:MAG: hypothetical protein R2939_21800 [Kofleriaceae bacterium]
MAAGEVTDDALTEFYRHRLLVPQVSPNALAKLKPKVIATIPADMAVELRVVPVTFDPDGNLMIAMSDPSDRKAVDELAFFTSKYIVRAVATQMQIAWCLAHYYGHVTELGRRLMQPREAGGKPTSRPGAAAPVPAPSTPAAAAPASAPADDLPPPAPAMPALAPRATEPPPARSSAHAVSPAAPVSVVKVGASAPAAESPAARRPAAARARKPDPPELAARVGEVQVKGPSDPGPITDEPRVVIDLGAAPGPDPTTTPTVSAEPSIVVEAFAPEPTHTGGDAFAPSRPAPADRSRPPRPSPSRRPRPPSRRSCSIARGPRRAPTRSCCSSSAAAAAPACESSAAQRRQTRVGVGDFVALAPPRRPPRLRRWGRAPRATPRSASRPR